MNEEPQAPDPVVSQRMQSAPERSADIARRMVSNDKMHRNHRLLSEAYTLGNKYSTTKNSGVRHADPYAAASSGRSSLRFLESRARSAGVPVQEIRAAYSAGSRSNALGGSTRLKQAAFDYAEARFNSYREAAADYEAEQYARRILDHRVRDEGKPSALISSTDNTPTNVQRQTDAPITWDGTAFWTGDKALSDGTKLSATVAPKDVFLPGRKDLFTSRIPRGDDSIKGLLPALGDPAAAQDVEVSWSAPEFGLAKATSGLADDQFYMKVHATTTAGGKTRRVTYVRPIDKKHMVSASDGVYLYNAAGTETAAGAILRSYYLHQNK